MVTGEQVKIAMIAAGIEIVDHHECSMCGVMVRYERQGENLFFNGGCGCSDSGTQPRTWQSAADWINMQSNVLIKAEIAKSFGLNIGDN